MSLTKGTPESSQIITLTRMYEERGDEIDTLRARVAELEADEDGYRRGAKAEADRGDELLAELKACRAERDRLWAWHDEAVSRVSCHLCAVNLPQPLKREK